MLERVIKHRHTCGVKFWKSLKVEAHVSAAVSFEQGVSPVPGLSPQPHLLTCLLFYSFRWQRVERFGFRR